MKVIVKCENCGNEVEVSPVTIGKIAYWGQGLRNMNFDIDSTEIDVELLESEVSDPNDVEARLVLCQDLVQSKMRGSAS